MVVKVLLKLKLGSDEKKSLKRPGIDCILLNDIKTSTSRQEVRLVQVRLGNGGGGCDAGAWLSWLLGLSTVAVSERTDSLHLAFPSPCFHRHCCQLLKASFSVAHNNRPPRLALRLKNAAAAVSASKT